MYGMKATIGLAWSKILSRECARFISAKSLAKDYSSVRSVIFNRVSRDSKPLNKMEVKL